MVDEVRLGRDGLARGWLLLGAFLAFYGALVVAAVAGALPAVFLVQAAYLVLLVAVPLVVLLTRRSRDAVVVDEEGLAVEGRSGPHRWRWDELLELGAAKTRGLAASVTPGLVVLVRPDGRGWDSPGPNMPLSVALPVFGRTAQTRAVDVLRTACREHGVRFDETGLRMAEQPRPDSPLRTDRGRSAP